VAHRQYELMAMINMALLHNRLPPELLAQGGEFWDRVGGAPVAMWPRRWPNATPHRRER
jgi:hypothetical protein